MLRKIHGRRVRRLEVNGVVRITINEASVPLENLVGKSVVLQVDNTSLVVALGGALHVALERANTPGDLLIDPGRVVVVVATYAKEIGINKLYSTVNIYMYCTYSGSRGAWSAAHCSPRCARACVVRECLWYSTL